MPQHVLLTVLGVVARETCYVLNGKESRKRLAPLALFELLRDTDKPDLVLALCTQKAEENTLPILREDLHDQIEVKCVRVPNGICSSIIRLTTSIAKNLSTPAGINVVFEVSVVGVFGVFLSCIVLSRIDRLVPSPALLQPV